MSDNKPNLNNISPEDFHGLSDARKLKELRSMSDDELQVLNTMNQFRTLRVLGTIRNILVVFLVLFVLILFAQLVVPVLF